MPNLDTATHAIGKKILSVSSIFSLKPCRKLLIMHVTNCSTKFKKTNIQKPTIEKKTRLTHIFIKQLVLFTVSNRNNEFNLSFFFLLQIEYILQGNQWISKRSHFMNETSKLLLLCNIPDRFSLYQESFIPSSIKM